MGGCLSCFNGGSDKQQEEEESIAAAEARSKAAQAAQRRQEDFEKSPAGRAARAQLQAMAKQSENANARSGGPLLKWQMG